MLFEGFLCSPLVFVHLLGSIGSTLPSLCLIPQVLSSVSGQSVACDNALFIYVHTDIISIMTNRTNIYLNIT
jgi:hypothetical protein